MTSMGDWNSREFKSALDRWITRAPDENEWVCTAKRPCESKDEDGFCTLDDSCPFQGIE